MMRKKLESLLTAFFPAWTAHRLAARNRKMAKRKKEKSTGSRLSIRNMRENELRRYSDPYDW